MENTISFNTKFGWISATEINNKITKIQFCREKVLGKKSKNLKTIKKKIKKGKIKTYGEIAKKFKISPRYVGRVCGENNHLLLVPCHRIIRSDKTLGGFSAPGGVKLKRKLLEFEGIFI